MIDGFSPSKNITFLITGNILFEKKYHLAVIVCIRVEILGVII